MSSARLSAENADDRGMRRVMAVAAPIALAQLDPHSLSDLACYIEALARAVTANDAEKVQQITQAISEVFETPDTTEEREVGDILAEIESTAEGRQAVAPVRAENETFIGRYTRAKNQAGLSTQRQVAAAAGVSLNTINAIETQKTIPQFGTMQRLAKGLSVRTEWLLGHEA